MAHLLGRVRYTGAPHEEIALLERVFNTGYGAQDAAARALRAARLLSGARRPGRVQPGHRAVARPQQMLEADAAQPICAHAPNDQNDALCG